MRFMEEYTLSDTFKKNLEEQDKYYYEHLSKSSFAYLQQDDPVFLLFENHGYGYLDSFWDHYFAFRVGLSSLLRNPDTRDDPDFIRLCDTWRYQKGKMNFETLKRLYDKVLEKPVFAKNPIYNALFGSFLKSIHELCSGFYFSDYIFEID